MKENSLYFSVVNTLKHQIILFLAKSAYTSEMQTALNKTNNKSHQTSKVETISEV